MTNNTDPVRALIADWRESAAGAKRYSTTDYEDGYAAAESNCANRLEAALASAPQPSFDRRFADMLIGILGDVQDELGFTDEEKLCANGSAEIVSAIRELKERAASAPPSATMADNDARLLAKTMLVSACITCRCLFTADAIEAGFEPAIPFDVAVSALTAALAQQPAAPVLAKHQPCGCVICTCEDEQQCQGCGAKHCGNRTDHPPYVGQQPAAPSGKLMAWLRMKPDGTPDWAEDCIGSDDKFLDPEMASDGYYLQPLYTAPQQPAVPSGEAVACCNMVDYFNARACEKCRKVIEGWVFGDAAPQQPAGVDGAATDSAVAAIRFALSDPEGMTFLRLWNEGEFDALRREWPDAPVEVYVGADPLTAQQPAADFDAWQKNPYTKVLMKSIAEDYVPKHDQQPAGVDEAPTWSRQQPTAPGIYGIRGFNLCRPASEQFEAVVVVREHGGELVCNLHESTSEDDLESWAPICDLDPDFEWRVFVPGWQQQGGRADG